MTSTVALLTPLTIFNTLGSDERLLCSRTGVRVGRKASKPQRIGFQPFRDRYTLYNNYRAQPAPGGSAGRIMHNVPGDQSEDGHSRGRRSPHAPESWPTQQTC